MSNEIQTIARPGAVRLWARRALDIVWPRNCPFCSRPLADTEPGIVCPDCLASAKPIEPPFCRQCAAPFTGTVSGETFVCGHCQDLHFYFDRTVCACRTEGVVRDSILRFKYNREMHFGEHLVNWLLVAVHRWIDWREIDAIVPVPLHPRKLRQREFNQAEYLADGLSRALRGEVRRRSPDRAVWFGRREGETTAESGVTTGFNIPVVKRNLRRVKDTPTQTKLDAEARMKNLRDAFAVRDETVFKGKRLVILDDVFTTGATMDSCAKTMKSAGAREVIALAVARGV
jgi:predicted amidophosphoribosyltransferase